VLTPFPGFLWSFSRIFIRAPSGRKRFNVPGALNALTHELITVCSETYINAESVCGLFYKISESCVGIPVTLIPDNARYQKCRVVFELAEVLGIELLYIPPYSPNLNLIERLWKFVKKKCLWSTYAESEEFKTAVSGCLKRTHTTYRDELRTLLTLKFQTFEKSSE
jgi:transposase